MCCVVRKLLLQKASSGTIFFLNTLLSESLSKRAAHLMRRLYICKVCIYHMTDINNNACHLRWNRTKPKFTVF